jgi:5'-nucleotidase
MHILVTNDDGVMAPGLLALAQAMRPLGKVTVLAPDRNWSASGHVKTLERPLRVKEVRLADDTLAYACDGAPSDCVALAMLGFIPEPINLVVSGINPNLNIGHDVTYSGTVTAAMEAVIGGTPGMAFSLNSPEDFSGPLDYQPAARAAYQVACTAITNELTATTLLNINIPYLPFDQFKCFRVTRQGLRIYRDRLVKRLDPRERPYYWIGGDAPTALLEDGTDFAAVSEGCVSITPLQLDLTDYKAQQMIQEWQWMPKSQSS